jgi:hypothetical protein
MTISLNIVSLWALFQFEAANMIAASSFLTGCAGEWKAVVQIMNSGRVHSHPLSEHTRVNFLKSIERIRDASNELSMVATNAAAIRAFEYCLPLLAQDRPYSARDLDMLVSHAERIVLPFNDETRARLFFIIDSKHSDFFSDTGTFGDAVEDAFPSASPEIVDAGKCRALGRWTACVLHLMRALEPCLNELATYVGVDTGQNWNTALNQIDAKLKAITKSTDGVEAEQWASEASAHFRVVKNAWRNHAAHGRARYNEDEAVAIFNNVQFLMRTLASRLSE